MSIQDKIPNDPAMIMHLKEKLEKMSDKERDSFFVKLLTLNLKNPIVGLVLSIFT